MTKAIIPVVAAGFALLGGAALAQSALDADGDGMVTLQEMQAVLPDLTEETFMQIDANADGAVDAEELAAAEEAGTLPPMDG